MHICIVEIHHADFEAFSVGKFIAHKTGSSFCKMTVDQSNEHWLLWSKDCGSLLTRHKIPLYLNAA